MAPVQQFCKLFFKIAVLFVTLAGFLTQGVYAQQYLFNRADFAAGNGSSFVAAADLNGDSTTDLVTVNTFSNTISVLLSDGSGNFAPKTDYSAGKSPVSLAVADFNGDGKLDLAVTNQGDDTVSLFGGNGDGSYGHIVSGHTPSFATLLIPSRIIAPASSLMLPSIARSL